MTSSVVQLPARTFATLVWRTLVEPSSEWTVGDYIRSRPFELFGLTWALEVYPVGCAGSPGAPAAELCLISDPPSQGILIEGMIHAWKDRGAAFLATFDPSCASVVVPRIASRVFPGDSPLAVTVEARALQTNRTFKAPEPGAWSPLRARESLPPDAEVEVEGTAVPVHTWAAACSCPKLFAMLRQAGPGGRPKLPGKLAWGHAVVDSLYTGQLPPFSSVEDTVGILGLTSFLEMDLLRSSCELVLRMRVSPENVCELIRAAALHSLPGLAAEASRCLGKNFPAVEKTEGWKALSEAEKDLVIRELCSWAVFASSGGSIAQ